MDRVVIGDKGLAKELEVSPWTVFRWRRAEGLPYIHIGGRYLYDVESVKGWLKSKEIIDSQQIVEIEQIGIIRPIK